MPFIFIVINILLKEFIDFPGNQMGWPFFYLCWFPEIQKKMVEEIKSVCGDDVPKFKVIWSSGLPGPKKGGKMNWGEEMLMNTGFFFH